METKPTPPESVPEPENAPQAPAKPERRYYKGRKDRPIYTEEDRMDPNYKFPLPPEPEWEAEWNRLEAEKNKS